VLGSRPGTGEAQGCRKLNIAGVVYHVAQSPLPNVKGAGDGDETSPPNTSVGQTLLANTSNVETPSGRVCPDPDAGEEDVNFAPRPTVG
jgi:hypothetical protein